VIETEGALPPARRKRRRPKQAGPDKSATVVPLSTVTLVRAYEPFGSEPEAREWLGKATGSDSLDHLLDEAFASLNRALAAEAAATGRPFAGSPVLAQVLGAKVGYGDGDRVADGRFVEALEVDARGGTAGPLRERLGRTRPLARIAATLGDRERAAACEFLVPRVRADLDAGRVMAAGLAIENAARATVVEYDAALDDPGHHADLDRLEAMLPDLTALTDGLLSEGRPWAGLAESLEEPLGLAERILRRRRVLDQ
jgi:hypothetical protein